MRDWFGDERGDRRFLVLAVLLAAVLRFLHLGSQSMWVDEMLTIGQITPKDGYSIWDLLLHNIHGPLHAFTVYLFRLAHDGDAWLRAPSAIAGTATIAVFYVWARRYLEKIPARLATILLVVHPLHIHYSQEVRNYAFVVFFGLLSCVAFDRLCDRFTPRRAAGYALAVAAALLSNFSAAFLFATHTVIYFLRGGAGARSVARWVGIAAVVLILVSPWVYRVHTFVDFSELVDPVMPGELQPDERLRGETTVSWTALPYAAYTFSVGFTLGPSLRELHYDATMSGVMERHWPVVAWSAVVFGMLFLAGFIAMGANRRGRAELLLYLTIPVLLTLLLNWQNAKAFNVRYVLVALPAYLCFLGAGASRTEHPGRRPGPWRTVHSAAAVAALVTMLVSLGNYYYNGRYVKEDVRSAMRYIEERMAAERMDACVVAPTVIHAAHRYRTGNYPIFTVFARPWLEKSRVDAQLEPVFAGCNSVWYVRARPWVDDYDGYVSRTLMSRYRVTEEATFDGVKLFLLVRPKPESPSL